jgi:hypothetical protein
VETQLFDSPGIVAADTPSSMQIKAGKYYVAFTKPLTYEDWRNKKNLNRGKVTDEGYSRYLAKFYRQQGMSVRRFMRAQS